jgi:O-antigen biosynthesis protein
VQDFEPLFYPAGTTSSLCQATYRFGFLGICNTVALEETYRALGGEAISFTPAVDPTVFHRRQRPNDADSRPPRVFAYMRPSHLRNGFELVAQALTIVKKTLGDGVEIFAAGADWQPAAFGLDGIVTNLGLLNYRTTGALYRQMDVAAVVMMTSHPSYLPFELMACGVAVITNHNEKTRWLLEDGVNCFLSETTSTALGERLLGALNDAPARLSVARAGTEMIERSFTDWHANAIALYERLWER